MSTEKNKRTRANGEGTIFKHRNRWVVSCYDIQKVRRTTSFKKKVEAEEKEVEEKIEEVNDEGEVKVEKNKKESKKRNGFSEVE